MAVMRRYQEKDLKNSMLSLENIFGTIFDYTLDSICCGYGVFFIAKYIKHA